MGGALMSTVRFTRPVTAQGRVWRLRIDALGVARLESASLNGSICCVFSVSGYVHVPRVRVMMGYLVGPADDRFWREAGYLSQHERIVNEILMANPDALEPFMATQAAHRKWLAQDAERRS